MLSMLLCLVVTATLDAKELTYYADFERPNLTYWNPKYYEYVTVAARRYTRQDPIHYVSVDGKTLVEFGNEVLVENRLYEFLSNEYRRSFIEFRFKLCDVFVDTKYDVFKPIYMKYVNVSSCPFPKEDYHYPNISVPNLPLLNTFPFRKGRWFLKATIEHTHEKLITAFVDWVIKQRFL